MRYLEIAFQSTGAIIILAIAIGFCALAIRALIDHVSAKVDKIANRRAEEHLQHWGNIMAGNYHWFSGGDIRIAALWRAMAEALQRRCWPDPAYVRDQAMPRYLEITAREWDTEDYAFNLIEHLHRQKEFSEKTFGPGARVDGIIDHIKKELIEVGNSGGELAEWIDVVLLALDGAWRSGASPEAVALALRNKLAKNESRQWPDWRAADPNKAIEHHRECAGSAS